MDNEDLAKLLTSLGDLKWYVYGNNSPDWVDTGIKEVELLLSKKQ